MIPTTFQYNLTQELYIDFMNNMEAVKARTQGSKLGVQSNGWTSPKDSYSKCKIVSIIQDLIFGKAAHELYLFDVWFTMLLEGGRISEHDHDGDYSLVYYISEGSSLMFPGCGIEVQAGPGRCVLFDAKEKHFVLPHYSKQHRISIAMNVHRRGE